MQFQNDSGRIQTERRHLLPLERQLGADRKQSGHVYVELRKRLQAAEEEQKEQERKRNRLLYQADHDELTGLYNKRSLNRYLEDVFEDCLLNEKELGIPVPGY